MMKVSLTITTHVGETFSGGWRGRRRVEEGRAAPIANIARRHYHQSAFFQGFGAAATGE